jgi:hypothetical protein
MALTAPLCCWGATENLKDLIATAGSSPRTLLLSSGTWVVQDDLKIPGTIHLKLGNGAAISVASGKTLTLHGLLSAPAERIFIGTGNVVFDSNSRQRVFPQWWGAKGDGIAEDTGAIQKAVNSFSPKGGEVYISEGTYVVDSLRMKSHVALIGSGPKSVMKQKSGANNCIEVNKGDGGSSNTQDNQRDIRLLNLQFLGTVETDGFSEYKHLLNLNAVSDVKIENCFITGYRGDGIYIGSGNWNHIERHNQRITIKECTFDGLSKRNRNAISIIDCDGLLVEKCVFKNSTGAIDFEPDDKFNIIKNLKISKNHFNNINGAQNIIQISIRPEIGGLDNHLENIEISNNLIDGNGKSNGIFVGQKLTVDNSSSPNNIVIRGNTVKNTDRAFMLFGLKNIQMTNNIFEECERSPYISYSEKNINVVDMNVIGNTFRNLSKQDGNGILIFGVHNLYFSKNIFDNIGKSDGTSGNALYFYRWGSAADTVTIEENVFKGKNTKVAIQQDKEIVTFPERNTIRNNSFEYPYKIKFPSTK